MTRVGSRIVAEKVRIAQMFNRKGPGNFTGIKHLCFSLESPEIINQLNIASHKIVVEVNLLDKSQKIKSLTPTADKGQTRVYRLIE